MQYQLLFMFKTAVVFECTLRGVVCRPKLLSHSCKVEPLLMDSQTSFDGILGVSAYTTAETEVLQA